MHDGGDNPFWTSCIRQIEEAPQWISDIENEHSGKKNQMLSALIA